MPKLTMYMDNRVYNRPYDNPSREKRERILAWKNLAVRQCTLNTIILEKALEIESLAIRTKDALHIAEAIYSRYDYLITTDRKILNKPINNPTASGGYVVLIRYCSRV